MFLRICNCALGKHRVMAPTRRHLLLYPRMEVQLMTERSVVTQSQPVSACHVSICWTIPLILKKYIKWTIEF